MNKTQQELCEFNYEQNFENNSRLQKCSYQQPSFPCDPWQISSLHFQP